MACAHSNSPKRKTKPPIERFYKYIGNTTEKGCILWKGSTVRGYGVIMTYNNKLDYAHRFSYEFFVGKIPKGKHVLHSCDNPLCVNPIHLFVGTNLENIKDKVSKNRQHKGESHPSSKLKKKSVRAIRKLYEKKKVSQSYLAKKYGVSQSVIHDAISGKSWKDV